MCSHSETEYIKHAIFIAKVMKSESHFKVWKVYILGECLSNEQNKSSEFKLYLLGNFTGVKNVGKSECVKKLKMRWHGDLSIGKRHSKNVT